MAITSETGQLKPQLDNDFQAILSCTAREYVTGTDICVPRVILHDLLIAAKCSFQKFQIMHERFSKNMLQYSAFIDPYS